MRTLKYEEVYRQEYRNLAEARTCLAVFIDKVYNHERLHSALGYRPPAESNNSLLPLEHAVTEGHSSARQWREAWAGSKGALYRETLQATGF